MKKKHSKFGRLSWIVSLGLLLSLSFGLTEGVNAATTTANVTITGVSTIAITPPSTVTIAGVTLDGDLQYTSGDFIDGLTVNDSRGTGAGWYISVSASQFSSGSLTLPKSSLTLKNADAIQEGYTDPDFPNPDAPIVYGSFTNPIDDGSVHTFVTAAENSGMGRWNIGWSKGNNLVLEIHPSLTKASLTPYSSTITWTLGDAPYSGG